MPTSEEIEAARTGPQGGWTKKRLAQWGVPWPPPKGWKARLIQESGEEPDFSADWSMPSKYDGRCWYCGESFAVGDEITMFRSKGAKNWGHADPCFPAWRRTDLGFD